MVWTFRLPPMNSCVIFFFAIKPMTPKSLACTDMHKTSTSASCQNWTTLTWCLPAQSSNQLWCIMRDTWLSEKAADLPCLDELQHFQAHTGHWLEWLNSQPAVYQRSGTGNQFSNAVWAYSLQLWSSPHGADTDRNTHVRGHVWM